MQFRNWFVRLAVPVALMASAVCAGWKWEGFPH
jgi:hypothetical protein